MEEEPAPVKPKPIVVEIVAQAVAATSDSVAEAAAQEMQAAERDRLAKRAEKVRLAWVPRGVCVTLSGSLE
jgi:hypothetical protein